jgi:PAS domain-containing protein
MLRALAGEHVRDREYAIATADGGPTRAISVNAQPIYNHDQSQIVGAVAVAHDVTAARNAAKQEAERLAQLQAVADRAAALSELVLALNAETRLSGVLETAVARLTDALGGASGAIYLRESDGRLVGQVGYRATGSSVAGSTIDLIASPATMAAFTRREPLIVRTDEATPAERATLDRLGAAAMTIAPLIANAEPIGVAYVATDDDVGPAEPEDLAFVASLAAQCAAAIDKGRFVDRLETAREQLRSVLDQVPQGIVVAEAPTGRLSLANRAATALLAAADGLPGTAAEVGFVTDNGAPFPTGDSPLERTLRTGEPSHGVTVTIARGDGSRKTVRADHLPLRDGDGRLVGVVGVFQDQES